MHVFIWIAVSVVLALTLVSSNRQRTRGISDQHQKYQINHIFGWKFFIINDNAKQTPFNHTNRLILSKIPTKLPVIVAEAPTSGAPDKRGVYGHYLQRWCSSRSRQRQNSRRITSTVIPSVAHDWWTIITRYLTTFLTFSGFLTLAHTNAEMHTVSVCLRTRLTDTSLVSEWPPREVQAR